MTKTKVCFEVVWEPKIIGKISDIMSRCDLGISKVEYPKKEIWSWETGSKVNLTYIAKMKKAVKGALEKTDRTLISIKKL